MVQRLLTYVEEYTRSQRSWYKVTDSMSKSRLGVKGHGTKVILTVFCCPSIWLCCHSRDQEQRMSLVSHTMIAQSRPEQSG